MNKEAKDDMGVQRQSADEGIRPYEKNPFYWQYKGEPAVLIGGSDADNIFQWAGEKSRLTDHLDLLKAAGGNYIRNTMSSRRDAFPYVDEGMAYPFKRREDGKYDLDEWDDEYWNRLDMFLAETHKRGIIVQLELWDTGAIVGTDAWAKQPWNPDHNVNYTSEDYAPAHADWFAHPFFLVVPALNDDPIVMSYQEKYIRKMLQISLQYDHVLYQIKKGNLQS